MVGSSMGSGCFAAGTYVTMADGSLQPIEDLKINDKVQTISSDTGEIITDTVFMFLDVAPSSTHEFIELSYESGTLTLTDYHLLYTSNNKFDTFMTTVPAYAKDVSSGSYIYVNVNGTLTMRQIIQVRRVTAKGLYAPLTLSGNILVNGVASSCYASISKHWLAHFALSPLRLLHHLLYSGSMSRNDAPIGVHWYASVLAKVFPYLLF